MESEVFAVEPELFFRRSGSNSEQLRIPDQAQLSRRRHVSRQRRCGDDGGTREVAFAPESHPVLPVAIEGRNRAFTRGERVRALAETGAAPGPADLSSCSAQHVGDGVAAETRIRLFDFPADPGG